MNIAQPAGLLCPRCEKPLKSHQDGECPHKKPTRRSFFGALFGAAAAAVVVPSLAAAPAAGDMILMGETFFFIGRSSLWKFTSEGAIEPLPMDAPVGPYTGYLPNGTAMFRWHHSVTKDT